MSRSVIAGAVVLGVLAFGAGSAAADMGYNWSGLYVGGSVGGAWADTDVTGADPGNHFHKNNTTYGFSGSGWIAGGHIGIQHQFTNWVLGVEASWSGADLKDTLRAPGVFAVDKFSADISSIFTGTARLGYARDNWLAYVKGGYANARVATGADEVPAFNHFGSSSERHNGWIIGAGLEYAFTREVIFGLEYNYIDLESKRHIGTTTDAPFVYVVDVDPGPISTVTARLSFKLGREPAPPAPLK